LKRRKISFILAAMLFLAAFLSSCADSKDINEKIIITTVAVDIKENEIYMYAEIANIEGGKQSQAGGSAGQKYIYVKSHGKTMAEARDNLERQLDKETYLSAVRTLIITEDFARDYLVEYLNRLRADETYRKKTITVITKEDVDELFTARNEKNKSVGFAIEGLMITLEEAGESFSRSTSRMLENLSSSYSGFLISCIGLQDKEIALTGYSVVNGTTIDGFISMEESKGLVFLKADNPKFSYIVPYQDTNFTIETSLKKRKIIPSYKDGIISFDLNFDFEAKLMYGDKKTPYGFDDAANAEVTALLTEMLKNELTDAVAQAQEKFKCDYLQFDDEFRIKFPEAFEKMDWQKEFEAVIYTIDVTLTLSDTWMMDYETNAQK